jgi:methylated-DNA-[protein]-cysteine S-methyltransferase
MEMLFFTVCGIGILMEEDSGSITDIRFVPEGPVTVTSNKVLSEAKNQIEEYFAGGRRVFAIPARSSGTAFSKKVYGIVSSIPYGSTMTYGEVAGLLGDPGKARAVGNALHRNPLPLLVPCHRVVAAYGLTGGFNGGPDIKKKLLYLERKCILEASV